MSALQHLAWRRVAEGNAQRHQLTGSSFSVLASGGRVVVGYGAHGRARMSGSGRRFDVYDGQRLLAGWPTLRDAKAFAERKASR